MAEKLDLGPSPRALVTGASAGIGAAYARRLAAAGCDLVLVARRRDMLEGLAAELVATGVEVEVLVADLTDSGQRDEVRRRLVEAPPIDFLVNNAGSGWYGRFDEVDPATIGQTVDLSVVAVAELARAALPGMVERGRGTVVNVASLLALSGSIPAPPLPLRAAYAAGKSFVLTLSTLLADELGDTGVRVQALCPGLVRTAFHELAGVDTKVPPRFEPMTPEEVVGASMTGLELGEVVCVPGLDDPALLEQWAEAERAVFLASAPGPLAARYRDR